MPQAPAVSASARRPRIIAISAAVAGRSAMPIAATRSAPNPTSGRQLTAGRARSSTARYSANVRHAQSRSGPMPPVTSGHSRANSASSESGAGE